MNKIQSISDIITNSSSEVFIIDTNRHDKIADFLKDLCEICGVDFYDAMEFKSITKDGEYYGYKCKKGNLVITSVSDNSIPFAIMDFIENIRWSYLPALEDVEIKNIQRHHLG